MPIVNRKNMGETAGMLELKISHFARGTYPKADGTPGALPVNRLLLVTEAPEGERSTIRSGGTEFVLKAGEIYFIPIYLSAAVKLSAGLTFFSLHFTLELHRSIDIFAGVQRIFSFPDTGFTGETAAAFDAADTFSGAVMLRCVADRLIRRVMEGLRPDEINTRQDLTGYSRALQYIRQHCSAGMRVEEVADFCGERRETFARKFTAAAGMTPKEYLTRTLLARAYILLARKDLLIKEVAEELGFANEFYFSRFIRKHTGLPPVKFRTEHLRY